MEIKKKVFLITLLGMCCVGFPMTSAASARSLYPVSRSISYASKKGWLKRECPVCKGAKGRSTWLGGWEPCEHCGGSGRVFRWWLVGAVCVLGVFFCFARDDKE